MLSGRTLIKTAAVMLILHFLLASYRLLPVMDNFHPLTFILPMGELVLLFILLYGRKIKYLKIFVSLLISSFLVFFIFGELFYRIFYMERFDMFSDMQLIPNFLVMLMPEDVLPPMIIKISAVIITVLVTLFIAAIILRLIRKLHLENSIRLNKKFRIILTAGAVILIVFFPASSPIMQTAGMLSSRNVSYSDSDKTSTHQSSYVERFIFEELSAEAMRGRDSEIDSMRPGELNLHFAVIESYGAVLFQKPVYSEFILDVYEELQPLLNVDGWSVRSGFVQSPAFGGRSWLADSTLLAGSQIVNQRIYDERVENKETAFFLELMKQKGYKRYYIAPGSTHASEEWKTAYPFEEYLLRNDFEYKGPFVSFGTMTDQYVYNYFASEIMNDEQKVFAFYLLVSSHTPFERIPVYKPDWDFSLKGREYNDNGYIEYFENNWLYGNELAEGYLAGINYSLETTIQYLTKILSDTNLMLIIGDHQPRKPVSGTDPGYPVPFHIIFPSASRISFPENWELSYGLVPPDLPRDYNTIPEMAQIPHLIEQLIK